MNARRSFRMRVAFAGGLTCLLLGVGAEARIQSKSARELAAVSRSSGKKKSAAALLADSEGLQEPHANIGPIDELRDALYRGPRGRRVLVQIRKASDALRALKYDEARRAASSVKNDPDFGDHARWILAEASILEAQADLSAKRAEKARQEAKDAINALTPIAADYPYSPLVRWIPRSVGRADLMLGQLACQTGKWPECRKQYESGLERLAASDSLVYVRPEDVEAYAEACSHHGPELCSTWLARLAAIHPHNTLEYKALQRKVPSFIEHLPHGASSGRLTIPYHLPDPDVGAFDDAMGKYLDHKDRDAIQSFRRFLDEYPRSSARFRAKYWLAQAMIHDKKEADARKLLIDLQQSSPLSYYGLLASWRRAVISKRRFGRRHPSRKTTTPCCSRLISYDCAGRSFSFRKKPTIRRHSNFGICVRTTRFRVASWSTSRCYTLSRARIRRRFRSRTT